jgi:hypothetical protein
MAVAWMAKNPSAVNAVNNVQRRDCGGRREEVPTFLGVLCVLCV